MTIIVALLLFSLLVFVHELGHFLFAKRAGVRIHEFAIGMGPKVYGVKKGETEYTVRALPLGGFVSMEGEDGESNDPRSFGNQSIWDRFKIIFMGPFFNIVFTIVLLVPVLMYLGESTTTLGEVTPDSPAQRAGIEVGDTITQINDTKIQSWQDVITVLNAEGTQEVTITVNRDGNTETLNVTPEKNEQGSYVIGIGTKIEQRGFFDSIAGAFQMTIAMIVQMLTFLGQLITGSVGLKESVAGPVGVISMVSTAASNGIMDLVYMAAVLNLNLGVMNLLPIPALDGGRLFMLGIEALRGGKKFDPNKEAMFHGIGFMLLMLFTLFVTFNDIGRLF